MFWLILLRFLFAQTALLPDVPITISLSGDAHPVDLVYQADGGEQINISARSMASEPIDTTLEILRDNQRLAFNDDHKTSRSGLSRLDSEIENFVFPAAGDYTIRINSFNGAQGGAVEIYIESIPLIAPCEMPLQAGQLEANGHFSCTLSVDLDSIVTVSVRDTSATLDPRLILLDDNLTQVAYNDDHASVDFSLNTLDSQIRDFKLAAGEQYIVQVSDFSGAAGIFELIFETAS